MLLWAVNSVGIIAKIQARIEKDKEREQQAFRVCQKFDQFKEQIEQTKDRMDLVDDLKPRINLCYVLGEMSFLIDKPTLLRNLAIKAEKFQKGGDKSETGITVVNTARTSEKFPLRAVRYKIVINGIASDGADVAALICNLEDSAYFRQVKPLYTRNFKHRARQGENEMNTEFEINCYLANYEPLKSAYSKQNSVDNQVVTE